MKTRNGFVSNSSTSSFVLIITASAYNDALDTMDKQAKELIEKAWVRKTKLGNQDVVYIAGMTSSGGVSSLYSVELNEALEEFKDYVEQKWDGDFSAVMYDGLIGKLKKGDFIKISEEI